MRGSSCAFKKRSATTRLCNTTANLTLQQIKSLFSHWTKEKSSVPPKLSSVSDNTYEDVTKGMKMILCSIYYCKMCKYFCFNEFRCFVCISIYMLQNIGIFKLRMGSNI